MKLNIKKWFSFKWLLDIFAPQVKEKVAPVVTPASKQIIWEGYECLDWLRHGDEGENQNREDGIAAAVAGGFCCIIMRLYAAMSGAWKIETLNWESDVEPGKFVGERNWTNRALAKGITRWVILVPKNVSAEYVADCFKAYKPQTCQFVTSDVEMMKQLTKLVGLDDQGVKISEPRFRKR